MIRAVDVFNKGGFMLYLFHKMNNTSFQYLPFNFIEKSRISILTRGFVCPMLKARPGRGERKKKKKGGVGEDFNFEWHSMDTVFLKELRRMISGKAL